MNIVCDISEVRTKGIRVFSCSVFLLLFFMAVRRQGVHHIQNALFSCE